MHNKYTSILNGLDTSVFSRIKYKSSQRNVNVVKLIPFKKYNQHVYYM